MLRNPWVKLCLQSVIIVLTFQLLACMFTRLFQLSIDKFSIIMYTDCYLIQIYKLHQIQKHSIWTEWIWLRPKFIFKRRMFSFVEIACLTIFVFIIYSLSNWVFCKTSWLGKRTRSKINRAWTDRWPHGPSLPQLVNFY